MDNVQNVSVEELAAEQVALQETKEEEVKAKIISELGFDEIEDAEKIEKLVAKEMKHNKDLSQAIGQKIKYREMAQKPPEPPVKPKEQIDSEDFQKKVGDTVIATLEKRDLDSLDYPDEIKNEISRLSKVQGVSVKKAIADPYIKFKIDEYEKAKATDEATISRTNKTGGTTKYSPDEPPDVDMSTPEGKKAYEEWFEQARKDPKYQPNIG